MMECLSLSNMQKKVRFSLLLSDPLGREQSTASRRIDEGTTTQATDKGRCTK